MDENKQLEQLMNACKVPPAGNDLANRIILAATDIRQRQSVWNWISKLFDEFKIPAPGYSFASLLIIGFLVGFLTYDDQVSFTNSKDNYTVSIMDIDQLFYEDEIFL